MDVLRTSECVGCNGLPFFFSSRELQGNAAKRWSVYSDFWISAPWLRPERPGVIAVRCLHLVRA
jgi:hypothetical protein